MTDIKVHAKRELEFSELHELALKAAKEIHKNTYETIISFNIFGERYERKGNVDSVRPTALMNKKGKVDVHNHPHQLEIPQSFSGEDAEILLRYNKAAIIVCGYGEYFYMKRGTCKLSAKQVKEDLIRIRENEYQKSIKKIPHNLGKREKIKHYKEIMPRFERAYHKELMKYAKSVGLIYGRCKL